MIENPYDPPQETTDAVVETMPSVLWGRLAIVQLALVIAVLFYLVTLLREFS
jgi:hypothetical protein